jgi:nucleotide-binding universal stress UspA family protein
MTAHETESSEVLPKRILRILVPTEFSSLASVAVDSLLALLKDAPDIRVTLVHVVPPRPTLPWSDESDVPHQTRHAEQLMEELRVRLGPSTRIDSRVLAGDPARVICALAADEHFKMIVLSSHGHTGLARVLLGSVAERVIQDASCPVLIVKPQREASGDFDFKPVNLKVHRILVGYDHRDGARRALCLASLIAKRTGASITLVHAVEPMPTGLGSSEAPPVSETDRARLGPALDWLTKVATDHATAAATCDCKAEIGHPWDIIIDEAKARSTDLIVVGPHEHTRWGHCFAGSTAQRVVRLAPCSVLAVK